MIRASIDLGTNTCLLLLAEWDERSREIGRVVSDHSTIVRLGKGVDRSRLLDPEAMERTLKCLRGYAEIAKRVGVRPADAVCVATSQARDARNGAEFFGRVEKETGFRFRVLSGEEEARYTFLGALTPGMDPGRCAVIDIGGGSTEIISAQGGKSVDVGCVRFTERFFKTDPVTDEEFWAAQDAIDEGLQPLLEWRRECKATAFIGVAGTVTTLALWHLGLAKWDAAVVERVVLSRGDVHRMVEELKWRTVREREALPGVEPGRADVLLAGALTLWRAMELLDFAECSVSTRGLRFGVLAL